MSLLPKPTAIDVQHKSCTFFPKLRLTKDYDPTTKLLLYELERDTLIVLTLGKIRYSIFIPQGYRTDLQSIPKWVRWYFDPADPETVLQALVHDWLYSAQGGTRKVLSFEKLWPTVHPGPLTRYECDAVLYWLMRKNGANRIRCKVYFLAVHVGGQKAWDDPN